MVAKDKMVFVRLAHKPVLLNVAICHISNKNEKISHPLTIFIFDSLWPLPDKDNVLKT